MPEDVPENQKTTIDGVGFVEKWPYPFGPHDNTPIENDYQGQGSIELYPQGNEGNKDYHPYELEYHVNEEGIAELRCYYGVIYYSITAIQTESFQVSSTYYFGVKGQSPLPGIGSITPAGFINQDTGATQKFARHELGPVNEDGSPPDDGFGTVYLRFWLNAKNKKIQAADLNYLEKGAALDEEKPCGELKKEDNKLMREEPNLGRYHLKIGSFNSPEDGDIPITQSIEDHIYYATTVVDNSADPTVGQSTFHYTTVADDGDYTPARFVAPPGMPDPNILPNILNSPRTTKSQTKYGPGAGNQDDPKVLDPHPRDTGRNNPDYLTFRKFTTTDNFPTTYQTQSGDFRQQRSSMIIPGQVVDGAAFGGTGAAGGPGTSDVTGYTTTGTTPGNIEDEYTVQLFGPDGSAGGSATSSSYSY